MRFFAPVFSVLAAVAVAQSSTCNTNCILIPNTGLQVTAGQPFTINWSNPSSSQITIKLQNGVNITPTSGITLQANVDASLGKFTVQIPSNLVNSNQYVFEIIDQANTNNINFSNMFSISGATAVSSIPSSTGTSASASSSASHSVTGSSSSASATSSGLTASSSPSQSSSGSSTRTSASSTGSSTSAPNSNSNGAGTLKVDGALIALIAGVITLY